MKVILNILVFTLVLSGCSEGVPVSMSEDYKDYVSVWQFRFEKLDVNTTHIGSILLAINSNGAAVYRRCEIDKEESNGYRKSSRYSTSFSDAAITQITESTITLV
jgi:hypothetical protein